VAVDREWPGQGLVQPTGQCSSGFGRSRPDLQDREFVTTQPPDDIFYAHGGLDALADNREQAVANRVSERIVHGLEPVEVQAENREGGAVSFRPGQFLQRSLAEQSTVRQTSQSVMASHMLHQPLSLLTRGHIRIGTYATAPG